MKSKGGAAYVIPFFTIAILVLFIMIIWAMVSANDWGTNEQPELGRVSEAVFLAEQRRAAIELYAELELVNVVRDAERQTADQDTLLRLIGQRFSSSMRGYPLDDIWVPVDVQLEGNEVVVTSLSDVTIFVSENLEVRRRIGQTSAGILTVWPTPTTEPIVTSLMGQRDLGGEAGTPNTAGLDIRAVNQAPGTPVLAAASALATPRPASHQVQLDLPDGTVCLYLHVDPEFSQPMEVLAGDVIATVADQRPTYSPHVDIRCSVPTLTLEQVADIRDFEGHYGSSNTIPADTTFVVTDERAYIDPFCLFSQDIQERIISYRESGDPGIPPLSGLDSRQGTTDREKFFETCNAYVDANIYAPPAVDRESITDEILERTLTNLEEIGPDGRTLIETIDRIAAEENVDRNLIIAMIAAESGGVIAAESQTGVQGLMQVTCPTAMDTIPEVIQNCDSSNQAQITAALRDPENSIRAGARFMSGLLARYQEYTHQIGFMAAAYNGGTGPVNAVIDVSGPDPAYETAMQQLSPEVLARFSPYNSNPAFDTREERQNKVEEIVNHGRKIVRFYELLGGAVAPLTASKQQIGVYRFSLELRTPLSGEWSELEQIRRDLETDPQAGRLDGVHVCSDYPDRISRQIAACAEQLATGTCSCKIPMPRGNQPVPRAVFSASGVSFPGLDGQDITLDYFAQGEDPVVIPRFSMGDSTEDTFFLQGSTITLGEDTENIADAFYLTRMEQEGEIVLAISPSASSVCQPATIEQYCLENEQGQYRFWVEQDLR